MAEYRTEEGTVVKTDKALEAWDEATWWDGRNRVSKVTQDQFKHQRLYKSRKGRYYVEHWSQWQGSRAHAEWVAPEEAARWLILNEHDLPADLASYEDEVSE
jgi:hypothetical protein